MDWARILAFVTGMTDQKLLARTEYLAAENRILKAKLKGRLKLSDAERATLGEIGHRLGRKVLGEVAIRRDRTPSWPGTASWSPANSMVRRLVEASGALANLGYRVCDQTVGNVLQRHALPPAPERKRTTTWPAFIRIHLALLAATDFLTAEVLTPRGLVTYYVLFFIHLESRRVDIAGITVHPDEWWMQPIARNVTMEGCGALRDC